MATAKKSHALQVLARLSVCTYGGGATRQAPNLPPEGRMAKGRVLLAHENADCLKIYGSVLAFEGYEVEVASDGDAALQLLATLAFDLVVSDLYLSSATDECFVRLVRANAFGAHLPVVVITGWTTEPHRLLALEAGTDAFLALPIRPGELSQIIARLLTPPSAPNPRLGSSEHLDPTVANGL